MTLGMALARIGHLIRRGLRSSFCGRHFDNVARLVAGASAYICDHCVTECVAVLEQPTVPGR
jgi:ATP-dependent Clp protease ATP-binding subunit ClpX